MRKTTVTAAVILLLLTCASLFSCGNENKGDDTVTTSDTMQVTTAADTAADTSAPAKTEYPVFSESAENALDPGENIFSFPETETYHNYIEVYDTDGRIYRVGDPYIMRYDGKYYLYSSVTSGHINGDIYVWESENLVDWECRGVCLTSSGSNGITYTAFAPEMVYYHGYFWLCEAPSGKGHYIFRSESPTGPFTLASDNIGKGIDGHFYVSDSGDLYFLFAQSGSGSSIRYVKLTVTEDLRVTAPEGSGSPLNASMNGWTEGPGHFSRSGYTYLTYTGNHVRDRSYRVGYSYTAGSALIKSLTIPKDNLTILSTSLEYPAAGGYNSKSPEKLNLYSGLGHSSNVIGPDLDSVYTAYHNEERGTFNRRLNVSRYFTNGPALTLDGFGITDVSKPGQADYTCREPSGCATTPEGFTVSEEKTPAVFTAEINFRIKDAEKGRVIIGYDGSVYYEAELTSESLSIYRTDASGRNRIKTAGLEKGNLMSALFSLRTVNGYSGCEIYLNGMRKIVLDAPLPAGSIGVAPDSELTSMFFDSSAFGTSDFDAVKNLPCAFPAKDYLKGENTGFSLKNGVIDPKGVRQGEKESTGHIDGRATVKLESGDWVKYAVNASISGLHAVNILCSEKSVGSVIEIIADGKYVYEYEVKGTGTGAASCRLQLGCIMLEKGEHTLKFRQKSGSCEISEIEIRSGAVMLDGISSTLLQKERNLFSLESGSGSYKKNTGYVTTADENTFAVFANSSYSDFVLSVSITPDKASSSGGIFFRADNYNLDARSGSEYCATGYYLKLNARTLTLYKYNWTYGDKLASVAYDPVTGDRIYREGATINLRIEMRQNTITVYSGENRILTYTDSSMLTGGKCALYTQSAAWTFTDLSYYQLFD